MHFALGKKCSSHLDWGKKINQYALTQAKMEKNYFCNMKLLDLDPCDLGAV